MNRLMTFAITLVMAVTSLGFNTQAHADFFHDASFTVGNDFMSGTAQGYGNAQNAVATSMAVSVGQYVDSQGILHIYTNVSVYGMFVNPEVTNPGNNPWCDLLYTEGLHASTSLSITDLYWGGEYWQYDNIVTINISGFAGIYVWDEDELGGSFSSSVSGIGAVPEESWSSVQIFEPGHPEWAPDWQISMSSEWHVTTGFHLVPTPGAFALLGLAGVGGISRRRRS